MRGRITETIWKNAKNATRVVLAGNPNVGKSTLFNALTGLSQHTGNWAGKTVEIAIGECEHEGREYLFCDLPGTYSLLARSREEEVARDFISFGGGDVTVVVADATRLRAGIELALQVAEATERCVLCLNFSEEAERGGAKIDAEALEGFLGIPTACVEARGMRGFERLFGAIERVLAEEGQRASIISYPEPIERAVSYAQERMTGLNCGIPTRFIALRMIENDTAFLRELSGRLGSGELVDALRDELRHYVSELYTDRSAVSSAISDSVRAAGARLFDTYPTLLLDEYPKRDARIDKIMTGRLTAFPIMALLLAFVMWITVSFANYPSAWLASLFECVIGGVEALMLRLLSPEWLRGLICDGVLGTLSSVVSVMLPPMAIFFPLFTLLEDSGYLPRIAYNLDRPLACSGACGKQALTMCMGLGCNAVGVMGCRIIDSPRERLAAILTNSLMPCNGRFPTVILISGLFFTVGLGGFLGGAVTALVLLAVIVLGAILTLVLTRVLTSTLLRGEQSFFAVEMPPYRRPDFLRVLTRSLLDRTLKVLLRAVAVSIPAGLVIWLLANLSLGGVSVISYVTELLDPVGKFLGMDGVILAAFILGLPANEIVMPISLMIYAAEGSMAELSLTATRELLVANGWTVWTAVSVIIFSLCHFPCSTTLITIKRETGSLGYAALAFVLPTVLGVMLCAALNFAVVLLA